jgi:hypothetical protein
MTEDGYYAIAYIEEKEKQNGHVSDDHEAKNAYHDINFAF